MIISTAPNSRVHGKDVKTTTWMKMKHFTFLADCLLLILCDALILVSLLIKVKRHRVKLIEIATDQYMYQT